MNDQSGRILSEGVALLRELTGGRAAAAAARSRVAQWRTAHPGLRADLIVHHPPASDRTEYDLLLGLPDEGADTVALSWCVDRGTPWAIAYADHWASNYLVTVNDTPTTIQEALLYLRSVTGNFPDLTETIVEHHLLTHGTKENPPSVSPMELQEGADRFRQAHGLFTAAATQRWLEEVRLSTSQFEELVTQNVQRRKFKQALVDEHVGPYYTAHKADFDVVRVYEAQVPDQEIAERLAVDARNRGSLRAALDERLNAAAAPVGLVGTMRIDVACQLPAWIREAAANAVVGPICEGRYWHLAEVLGREPAAALEGATRKAVADAVFHEWLTQQRKKAVIRWHWM